MKKKPVLHDPWRPQQWIARIFLFLAATVFVLCASEYQHISELKKPLFLWIFGGFIAAVTLLMAEGILVQSYSAAELWQKIRPRSVTQVGMLAYLLFTLISALLSPHGKTSWLGGTRFEGVVTISLCVLSFYYLSVFGKADFWLVYLFGLTLTLFSILSIIQLLGYNPFSLYPGEYNYYDAYKAYSGAYLGTVGNVDFVASFLCLGIPILWVYVLRAKERLRWILLLPLVLSLAVLVKMSVLAGFVGVFAGGMISLPFVLPMKKRWKGIYFSGATVLCLGILAFLYFIDYGQGIFHELHSVLHGKFSDSFGTGRFYIWGEVLERVPQNLLFGTGPDTMSLAGIQPFQRYDETYQLTVTAFIDAAHSEYLNILYHQGLFALLSYAVALGALLLRWIKKGRSCATAVLGAAVLAYLLQAAFGISQFVTAPLFWLCLGLLESALQNHIPTPTNIKKSKKEERK